MNKKLAKNSMWFLFLFFSLFAIFLVANETTRIIILQGIMLIFCVATIYTIITPYSNKIVDQISLNGKKKVKIKLKPQIYAALIICFIMFIFFMNYVVKIMLLTFIGIYTLLPISWALVKYMFKKIII